ncbi:MAG TPA: hypothetical protein DDY37_07210 [Legionella sp.]|nr:hypothetical protein [Legionella sp.]
MCAYFFAVKHSPNDVQLDEDSVTTKNMITNPSFKQFPDEIRSRYHFDREFPNHTNIITDLTNTARKKWLDVKAIDKEITVAFSLGIVASFSSFIPFNWLIAPMALIYTGYLAKERDTAYAEYTQAMQSLHRCCDWAVNQVSTTQGDMDLDQVKSMLGLLSQVMTKAQMEGIIADQFENEYFNTIGFNDESDAVKKETLDYKIYGFDQGGSISEILTKLAGSLKQMLTKAATEAMVYLNTPAAPGPN